MFNKDHVESSIASPIVAGDIVLGISGWLGVRQELVAVRANEKSRKTNPEFLYRIDRNVPLCTTPLVKDDLLMIWSDEGIVTCADLETGKVHWRKRVGGNFYASPIAVGPHVMSVSASGEVVILALARELQQLARHQLGQPSHSTPAVSNGVIYVTELFTD